MHTFRSLVAVVFVSTATALAGCSSSDAGSTGDAADASASLPTSWCCNESDAISCHCYPLGDAGCSGGTPKCTRDYTCCGIESANGSPTCICTTNACDQYFTVKNVQYVSACPPN